MTWRPWRAEPSSLERVKYLASLLRDSVWIDQTEEVAWLLGLADVVRLCPYGAEPSLAFDVESRLSAKLANEYRDYEQMSWEQRFEKLDALKAKRQRQALSDIVNSPREIDADAHERMMKEAQEPEGKPPAGVIRSATFNVCQGVTSKPSWSPDLELKLKVQKVQKHEV